MNTINSNASIDLVVNDISTKNNPHDNVVEQESIKNTENQSNENQPKAEISVKQLEMVAQQLQEFVGEMSKSLEFIVDKDSGRDVIKIIDKTNGDVIKQYPSEEVLDLVSKLSEATGSLVNEKI
jgi:flagellar protein FlaG